MEGLWLRNTDYLAVCQGFRSSFPNMDSRFFLFFKSRSDPKIVKSQIKILTGTIRSGSCQRRRLIKKSASAPEPPQKWRLRLRNTDIKKRNKENFKLSTTGSKANQSTRTFLLMKQAPVELELELESKPPS